MNPHRFSVKLSAPGAAIVMMTHDSEGMWVCIEEYNMLKAKYDRLAAKIPLTAMLIDIPSQSIELDVKD
jgi:hypothetical protein